MLKWFPIRFSIGLKQIVIIDKYFSKQNYHVFWNDNILRSIPIGFGFSNKLSNNNAENRNSAVEILLKLGAHVTGTYEKGRKTFQRFLLSNVILLFMY